MDLVLGCQSLDVPATKTAVVVGGVNSKRTGSHRGPALMALPWFWLSFIVVSDFGLFGDRLRKTSLSIMGSLGVHGRSRNLQPDLDTEGRFGFPLVFEDYLAWRY
jgi:hypothetical protein